MVHRNILFCCGMSPSNRAGLFCHITEHLIRAKSDKYGIWSVEPQVMCPSSSSVSWLLTWASGLEQEARGRVLIGLARLPFICSHPGECHPYTGTHYMGYVLSANGCCGCLLYLLASHFIWQTHVFTACPSHTLAIHIAVTPAYEISPAIKLDVIRFHVLSTSWTPVSFYCHTDGPHTRGAEGEQKHTHWLICKESPPPPPETHRILEQAHFSQLGSP